MDLDANAPAHSPATQNAAVFFDRACLELAVKFELITAEQVSAALEVARSSELPLFAHAIQIAGLSSDQVQTVKGELMGRLTTCPSCQFKRLRPSRTAPVSGPCPGCGKGPPADGSPPAQEPGRASGAESAPPVGDVTESGFFRLLNEPSPPRRARSANNPGVKQAKKAKKAPGDLKARLLARVREPLGVRGLLLGLLVPALVVGAWFLFGPGPELEHPPGVLVPDLPTQELVENGRTWQRGGFRIREVARFEIKARVLAIRAYDDAASELARYDVVLGWQQMSDQAVLDGLRIQQENRGCSILRRGATLSETQIVSQSGNFHLVPEDEELVSEIEQLYPGQLVRLRGALVDIEHPTGASGWWSTDTQSDQRVSDQLWVERLQMRLVRF